MGIFCQSQYCVDVTLGLIYAKVKSKEYMDDKKKKQEAEHKEEKEKKEKEERERLKYEEDVQVLEKGILPHVICAWA